MLLEESKLHKRESWRRIDTDLAEMRSPFLPAVLPKGHKREGPKEDLAAMNVDMSLGEHSRV